MFGVYMYILFIRLYLRPTFLVFSFLTLPNFLPFVFSAHMTRRSHQVVCTFQLERGESFFTFARDMTLRSTKALVQPTIPEDLGPWRSKLLWASRVLPMPLVGLLIIGGVCADVKSPASEYPELEALSRLDFGAAIKVFLAKRLTSE